MSKKKNEPREQDKDKQAGSGQMSRRDKNQSNPREKDQEEKRFSNDDTLESDSDWIIS